MESGLREERPIVQRQKANCPRRLNRNDCLRIESHLGVGKGDDYQ
jgi:hypothetical protein